MSKKRVELRNGQLFVEGKETCLWGGELQYFRVRHETFHPVSTVGMWADTLDSMRNMGMNLVSTYVPWDYHERQEGRYDFGGARDLGTFLELCHDKGFYVHLKPGPYITAEWPTGWNSFGALPEWLVEKSPGSWVKKPSGKPFSYHPFLAGRGLQCSLLDPSFLSQVKRWFSAVAPFVHRFTREKPCVVFLQLDNETNLFWQSRYAVDHSDTALAHYRAFLKATYDNIERLNQVYGTRYADFSQVQPPRKPPSSHKGPGPRNVWRRDWFEAGHAMIAEYLGRLREMWTSLGVEEDSLLFTTNDTLHYPPLPSRRNDILFARPRAKKEHGLFALDCYPRHNPFHGGIFDAPFQGELALRAMDEHAVGEPQGYRYAAEIQGGMFPLPLLRIRVRPEQTDQLLCKLFGHGLRGGSVFVIRDGLNADGSRYAYQAALDEDGIPTARYQVLRKYGRMLNSDPGKSLLRSEAMDSPVALLVNGQETGRMEGTLLDERSLWGHRYSGWLGLLLQAGFSPQVLDVSRPWSTVPGIRVAVFVTSGLLPEVMAGNLLCLLDRGVSLLVTPCWPRNAPSCALGPLGRALLEKVLPLYCHGAGRHETLEYRIRGVFGRIRPQGPVRMYDASHGQRLLWPRKETSLATGLLFSETDSRLLLLGADVASEYGSSRFEHMPIRERWERRRFLRAWMEGLGVVPILDWPNLNVTAWCRKGGPGDAFVFATNTGGETCCQIRLMDPEGLGFPMEGECLVQDLLQGNMESTILGKDLYREGIPVVLNRHGTAISRILCHHRS